MPWVNSTQMLVPFQYANTVMPKCPPSQTAKISWIYGYQSEICRDNVKYNLNGNIIYPIGRYVVLYDISLHSQKLFTGHQREITALAIHPVIHNTLLLFN